MINLNIAQRHAVFYPDKALYISAGPGSGKTKVIIHRINKFITRGIPSNRILAMTFSNRAAKEMIDRLSNQEVNIGTFHGISNQWLRKYGSIPYTILDSTEQTHIIKQIIKAFTQKESEDDSQPNENYSPEEIPKAHDIKTYISTRKITRKSTSNLLFEKLFVAYNKYTEKYNYFDFDDLLLEGLKLIKSKPEIAEDYDCILVDEFQDTNIIQYQILKELSIKHQQITVVGDADQQIYSWRHADVRNEKNFICDFNPEIIHLEQNYRSTPEIVQKSTMLINAAVDRDNKNLWTNNSSGETVKVMQFASPDSEARNIACRILKYKNYNDVAILVRLKSQTREFEHALREFQIPYVLKNSIQFYEREEVQDIIAYIKVIAQPDNIPALKRIINIPRRGIGKKTLQEIINYLEKDIALTKRTSKKYSKFIETIQNIQNKYGNAIFLNNTSNSTNTTDIAKLIRLIAEETKYLDYLKKTYPNLYVAKWENVLELATMAHRQSSLQEMLDTVILAGDMDEIYGDAKKNRVTISTIHSAKGLEYPVVFIPGVEQDILPHFFSIKNGNIDEERRLLYVAMTRAKDKLILTYASNRFKWEGCFRTKPSQFLKNL